MQSTQADCEQLLKELSESMLFATDFPRRIRLTDAQGVGAQRPSLLAIERARDICSHLVEIVRTLGWARYEPAIAVLTKLWRNCALVPVRDAAGHALFAMQTDEARSALESMIEDSDHLSTFLGARAVFDRDFERAFERLKPYFEEQNGQSPEVGRQVLVLLAPSHVVKRDA